MTPVYTFGPGVTVAQARELFPTGCLRWIASANWRPVVTIPTPRSTTCPKN